MSDDVEAQKMSMDQWFTRVRALLRRLLLQRIAWMPGIQDGAAGRALVAFVMGQESVAPNPDVEAINALFEPVAPHLPSDEGVGERFETFRKRLELSELECDALWILLAPELDSRFLSVYRMIWGAPGQRYCDGDFLMTLLAPDGPHRIVGLLDEYSNLVRLRFVESFSMGPASSTYYRPSQRLIGYLSGVDAPSPRLASLMELSPPVPPRTWLGFQLLPELHDELARELTRRRVVVVEAAARSGFDVMLQQLAGGRRQPLLRLDLADRMGSGETQEGNEPIAALLLKEDAAMLRALLREARLAGAMLHLSGAEVLAQLSPSESRQLADLVASQPEPTVFECNGAIPSGFLMQLLAVTRASIMAAPPLTGAARRAMWAHLLRRRRDMSAAELDELSAVPASPRIMEMAALIAGQTRRPVAVEARHLVAHALPRMASRVEVTLGWDQVVLRPEELAEIEHIRTFGAHYDRIMTGWGLGKRRAGRGVKMLFSGPPGTGKTLTAGLIARDLNRDLYQVDVSAVLSKWVGETERHLAQLFREARGSGAALLFDEADSLFRKRSDGDSAGERFGSQLVNFLLQEMQIFDGMVILTTNLEAAIDPAFARRLNYHVRFKNPDAELRAKLWRVHLPTDLPLAEDVDLEYLGETFELAGGDIHKAAIRAAVNAIHSGRGEVGADELEDAILAQYAEKGRLPPSSQLRARLERIQHPA